MLEGKISNNKSTEMEFNRLYNIMLVSKDQKIIVTNVYADLVELLKNNKSDKKITLYSKIALKIVNYLIGNRDFSYLDEF